MTLDEEIDHLLWEWAARQGLIDSIGSVEWTNRFRGHRFSSTEWIVEHEHFAAGLNSGTSAIPAQLYTMLRLGVGQ